MRIAMLFFSFLTAFLSVFSAHAEYRVFELVITNTTSGQSRKVKSTLDDLQYAAYHPVSKNETIEIGDTWMCWRRSDLSQDPSQSFCPNPRGPASTAPTQSPAPPSAP